MPDRGTSSPGRGGSASASAPPPPPSCRACAGATFYSRAAAVAGRPPTCAGISRKLSEDAVLDQAALPPDVTPHGDWSFCCVGLASYPSSPPPPQAPGTPKGGGADDVALPQCFGVQIIRAQAVRATPLEAGAAGSSSPGGGGSGGGGGGGGSSDAARPARPPRREPLTAGVPPPRAPPSFGDALSGVPDLVAKVGRQAQRVAQKMGQNAAASATAARKAAESLVDAVLPGSGGRDK